jgi:Flp pilus assembly protein CpaB
VTSSMAPPRPSGPPPAPVGRTGLRLSSGTYQRRPWQIGLGVALVVLCGAIGATVFQSSAKRVSVVIAARDLPAGTVLTAADLAIGSLPANDNVTAMSSSGAGVLVGQQLAVPTTRGQLMVRAMVSSQPPLAAGSQVVGVLLKGNQIPSVPIVVGDQVQVIAVSTPGQASSGNSTVGTSLVAQATVLATGPPPANQTQYVENLSLSIPATSAPEVAGYAAADQIAITLTSGHAP